MHEEEKYLSELLQRYLQGTCSPEEEMRIRQWYDALGSSEPRSLEEEEAASELQGRLWRQIRKRADLPSRKSAGAVSRKWLLYPSVAAAVLLLLFAFFFRREKTGPMTSSVEQPAPATIFHKTNNSNQTILVVLQDESMVWLKPSGSIHYQDFSKSSNRELTLEGEAFFEVAKHPGKPFLVHSGNVVTRVTGTKFNIKAYEKAPTVEVEVTEGTVEVSGSAGVNESARETREKEAGLLRKNVKLSAREKAVYNTVSSKFEKLSSIVSNKLQPVQEISQELAFEFNDTPLRKVVDLLEEAYPVSIELGNREMENCPLTASLNNETLEIKLALICRSLGATFHRSPGKILITGNGCAP